MARKKISARRTAPTGFKTTPAKKSGSLSNFFNKVKRGAGTIAKKSPVKIRIKNKFVKGTLKVLLWLALTLIGIIVVDYVVQIYNNSQAAIVNGSRISYGALDTRLRQTYSSEIVENLVNEELVRQEAKEKGINISQQAVTDEYNSYLESFSGGEDELLDQLSAQGIDKKELFRRIEITLMVNKLVEDRIAEPTEDEIKEYYDTKYSYLEEKERPAYEDVKDQLKSEVTDNNIQNEIPIWLQEVREGSTIQNNIEDKPALKFMALTTSLLNRLINSIKK